MREILFRGKIIDNGEWAYGCYVEAEKLDKSGTEYFIIEKNADGSSHMVIPETVGQYTGLNDKNGTRIFDGDIVETSKYGYENVKGQNYNGKDRFVVQFSDGTYVLENKRRRFCLRPDSGVEIIGNIHDNPELLEVEA